MEEAVVLGGRTWVVCGEVDHDGEEYGERQF